MVVTMVTAQSESRWPSSRRGTSGSLVSSSLLLFSFFFFWERGVLPVLNADCFFLLAEWEKTGSLLTEDMNLNLIISSTRIIQGSCVRISHKWAVVFWSGKCLLCSRCQELKGLYFLRQGNVNVIADISFITGFPDTLNNFPDIFKLWILFIYTLIYLWLFIWLWANNFRFIRWL